MSTASAQVLQAEEDWGRAMVSNDPDAIGRFMADDWIIIGTDGIMDRATFLGVVKSGGLTHDTMEGTEMKVRVYGDAAVLTGIAVSKGMWQGKAFAENERFIDVWVKLQGQWRCVITQLTRIDKK